MSRTRIKFCGLTRAVDVESAARAGADALGFVCYSGSPRYVDLQRLAELARAVPPFVVPTLLFVNAAEEEIRRALELMPNALLQFQGDETAGDCARYSRPFVRAVRVGPGVDLLDCESRFASATALLADAPAPDYGGGGKSFDWSQVPAPQRRTKPLILAGGLNPDNVRAAIVQVRPFAVDVSSGIEESKGIKSNDKMLRFVVAVRETDQSLRDHA